MEELEKKIGYKYNNISLLENAMTHSSYANESKGKLKSNERLEFLGDAVLSIVTAEYLYKHCPNMPEGELSKKRASLVCEKALFAFSKEISLSEYIMLGKGEKNTNGNQRPSIMSDAFESVIASIYLDGGMEEAKKFILRFIARDVQQHKPRAFKDYKTILQEIIQKNPEEHIEYDLVSETGPDHDKHFVVEVLLNTNVLSRGGGRTKKEAEQEAARKALELMGY